MKIMKKSLLNICATGRKKGFTLFIALIVSSILLAVGFSIGNIILKQLKLSTAGKESQLAFYAADSASECAMYWDRKDAAGNSVIDVAFGTTTSLASVQSLIKCGSGTNINSPDGSVFVASKISNGLANATTTFYINYGDVTGYGYNSCAKVTVAKTGNNTAIDARGYNAGFIAGTGCDLSGARTVERGLLLTY